MMTPEEQAYVRKLEETIVKLEARIAELERRLNMNSSNSSKPPSTDNPNQKKRSLRKPSGKKPGGQSGHKGTTLKLPCAPSKIIPCNPKECAGCALAGQCQGKCLESRYEIDAEITVVVRKYSQMEYLCPKSNTCLRGNFPENITATKCYGPKIQALAIGMNTYCAVSVNKIHEFFMSVLKLPVSTGFIHNAVKKYAGKLDDAISSIKQPYILRLSYMLMKQVCVHRGKQYGYIMFLLRGTPTSMSAKNAGKMACGRGIFSNITKA